MVALIEEFLKTLGFHEAELMVGTHSRRFFTHLAISFKGGFPVTQTNVTRLHGRDTGFACVLHGRAKQALFRLKRAFAHKAANLSAGIFTHHTREFTVFLINGAARVRNRFGRHTRHFQSLRVAGQNVTAGAIENDREFGRNLI